MRFLTFNVDHQTLSKDLILDNFEGLHKGSSNYLKASFKCDESWNGVTKVAKFRFNGGEEYIALTNQNDCVIPDIVTKHELFKVSLVGVSGSTEIQTNEELVRQE